jgi:hypothetical protein
MLIRYTASGWKAADLANELQLRISTVLEASVGTWNA